MPVTNYVAREYALYWGHTEEEVIDKIRKGEINGFEDNGYWYVKIDSEIQNAKTMNNNEPDSAGKESRWGSPMFLIIVVCYVVLTLAGLSPVDLHMWNKYGSPFPCKALLNAMTRDGYAEAQKQGGGALLGVVIGRVAIEQQVDSMSFRECASALSSLEKGKRD